jgi:hypothetical protein
VRRRTWPHSSLPFTAIGSNGCASMTCDPADSDPCPDRATRITTREQPRSRAGPRLGAHLVARSWWKSPRAIDERECRLGWFLGRQPREVGNSAQSRIHRLIVHHEALHAEARGCPSAGPARVTWRTASALTKISSPRRTTLPGCFAANSSMSRFTIASCLFAILHPSVPPQSFPIRALTSRPRISDESRIEWDVADRGQGGVPASTAPLVRLATARAEQLGRRTTPFIGPIRTPLRSGESSGHRPWGGGVPPVRAPGSSPRRRTCSFM